MHPDPQPNPASILPLSPTEVEFLTYVRALEYGIIERLVVRHGEPVFAEVVSKTVKFDGPK